MFQPTYGIMANGAYGQPFMGYGYSAATGWPTMKQGATDAGSDGAVSVLVNALKRASYEGKDSAALSALKVDAKSLNFGLKVDAEVRKFQKAKGLDADGVVGPATWKALGERGTPTSRGGGGGGGGGSAPASSDSAPSGEQKSASIMDSEYFWPGVILGTTAVGAGVWYFFFNK